MIDTVQGYWHITAIATCASIISVLTQRISFFIVALIWLVLLKQFKRLNILPFVVSLAALIFFIYYIPSEPNVSSDDIDGTPIYITGKVVSSIEQTEKKLQFTLRDEKTREKYLLIYFKKDEQLLKENELKKVKFGATCQISGEVMIPMHARNPGQFNFYKYLREQGINTQVRLSSFKHINCHGSSIFQYIFQFRQYLLDHINNLPNKISANWIQALVLGERQQLQDELIDLFQRWGLSHILAISGLHVGIIVASLYILLVRFGILTKEAAEWILITFLPIYAFIAGAEPSVLRASLMLFTILLINRIKISFHLQDTISIVFLILIIVDPYIVYHVGFQFSFLVTFALILSRPWLQKVQSPFWQLLIISYVSQMVILPLQFHYFHTFQPLSIFVNFLLVPYFSLFVIPLMFILIPLTFITPNFAQWLMKLFERIQQFIEIILHFIDQYLYTPFILGEFPIFAAVIYYVAFVLSIKYIEKQQFKRAFQYSLTFVALIVVLLLQPYFSKEGTITMLDIGQGDAFVIELPFRKGVFFIDAGAHVTYSDEQISDTVYHQVIKPFLYSRGIFHIDAIILSHAHVDHYGSSQFIIEDFHTPLLIVSEFFELNDLEKKFLHEHRVDILRVRGADSFTLHGQTFNVLSPVKDELDIDDNSLVLQSKFGNKTWLFTGDISRTIERKIISQYNDQVIDVLKVAHHGSRTSTEPHFIKHFNPQYALISVGHNNSYGHPHKEVIETLKEANINILRTDEHGAVQYIFTEESGTFFTFLP